MILKFDLKTPGREDSDTETKLYTRADVNARKENQNNKETTSNDSISEAITRGLGGKKNISDVDCCATRLRCTVKDASLINDSVLKATGASGVVHKGNGVQVIYGPNVTVIKSNLEDYLVTASDTIVETKETSAPEKVEEKMGLSAVQMIGNEQVIAQVEEEAQKTVNERIEHEIDRLLNGYGG